MGTYKVRNEIETKRNETKSTKTKRNETNIFFFFLFLYFVLSFIFFLPFSSYQSMSFCFRWFRFHFIIKFLEWAYRKPEAPRSLWSLTWIKAAFNNNATALWWPSWRESATAGHHFALFKTKTTPRTSMISILFRKKKTYSKIKVYCKQNRHFYRDFLLLSSIITVVVELSLLDDDCCLYCHLKNS
jgi:hypothetical protein